jgi:DNA polymerase-3 subunit epsilon
LSLVYLELNGGKERGLDLALAPAASADQGGGVAAGTYGPRPRPLAPRSTDEERAAHAAFVATMLKEKAIWARIGF